MTRNGLALLVAALGGVLLLAAFWLSVAGQGSRLDVVLLAAAFTGHVIGVLAWWAAPWAPRWIVAGYGLIIASSGLGFLISAPADAGATMTFYGMAGAGLLTIIAAVIHR